MTHPQVLESVVKNCGSPIHEEVASKAFMDELREMVHKTTNDKVRAKVLELTQTWAFAFRNTPKYSIIPVQILIYLTSEVYNNWLQLLFIIGHTKYFESRRLHFPYVT